MEIEARCRTIASDMFAIGGVIENILAILGRRDEASVLSVAVLRMTRLFRSVFWVTNNRPRLGGAPRKEMLLTTHATRGLSLGRC